MKGAQQGLKGQCVLVPTDLKKIQTILPGSCGQEDLCDQSGLVLWKLLTDKNARESNNRDQTDSDDDIEGNEKCKERVLKESSSCFPTVMYNVDGPSRSPS